MKKLLTSAAACCLLALFAGTASAAPFTFTGSSGSLHATVTFNQTTPGGPITVVLTNSSTADSLVPSDLLSGLFFNLNGNPVLTPASAVLTAGSTIINSNLNTTAPPNGNNVGGEWGYAATNAGVPTNLSGFSYAISSSGYIGGGNEGDFNGPNLHDPNALDGPNYGISSAGDDPTTQNGGLASVPYVKNSVTFTLNTPSGYTLTDVSSVWFQYGTSLSQPGFSGTPGGGGPGGGGPGNHAVPAPAGVVLAAFGLLSFGGGAGLRRLRRKSAA